MNKTTTIQVLGNIYNNILKGVELGKTLIMLQGSARAGKTYNTMIYIIQVCLSTVVKVSIVRQSLPVIKRSVLEDFKDIMLKMGIFEDKRLNKTECKYYFANGSVLEFFSADDEQKLRGSYRDILYINEANEISFYAFSMLRQRTYKYTIVDYNPSFTEEHWLYPLMSDKRSYHFISTFMDNVFLPEPAREEILSYKETNPALWQIFGLGEFAIVDGLVFPKENWDIIANEEYPSWKKEEVLGLDWGFTCFTGDTMITTIEGDMPIKDVKVGNLVLTREGYRRVNAVLDKGIKKAHKKTFITDKGAFTFVATDNHKFYSNGKWKKYGELTEKDNLYMLSSLTERYSRDTQVGNTQTTILRNGKKMGSIKQNDFIEQFGNTITELYQMDMTSIIKTATLSTTILVIYSWLRIVSIVKFIDNLLNIIKSIQSIEEKYKYQRIIGRLGEMFGKIACKLSIRSANGAEKILYRLMYTKDFAAKNTIINGNINRLQTLLKQVVAFAEKLSCKTNISNKNAVQTNVHTKCCGIQEIIDNGYENVRVYDLSIDGCHEYFANGVLVHNCDPSTAVGVIIIGDDIYVRQIYYEYGLQTQDIAERLSPYSSNYKYCDIDNRLITELEMNGVTLLNPTKKNGDSILSGIRIMNQKHIHITESSTDVIKEFKNYVYKKDRNGVTMYDKNPVGKFDHCFTGETMIKTLDGEKRIDQVKVGDFVYTGKGSRQVAKCFDNGIQDVCEYKITYENGTSITINSTPSHKVKTSIGWVQIKDIKAGDAVFIFNSSFRRTKDVSQLCSVKEISVLSERKEHTYNLMIDEIHEYFANGLLVSNCVDAIRYAVLAEFTNTGIEEDIPLTKESLNLFI